jgi:hypothetical protein
LPVDSHQLVALAAPRPVFIGAGDLDRTGAGTGLNGDGWVDPKGSFLAGAYATPVYELLGGQGLPTTEFPPIETALTEGDIGFRQHTAGHTQAPNWPVFISFADRYFTRSDPGR